MKNVGTILGIVNTVAIALVLGLFVFTKVIYKKTKFTESKERVKLEASAHKVDAAGHGKAVLLNLDPVSVNLDTYSDVNGKQKVHFATLNLTVEIRSEKEVHRFEEIKPIVMDQIIQTLGKKKFDDLNQVQGRYVFRSQIVDGANAYLKAPVVTEVYFSDFLLQ